MDLFKTNQIAEISRLLINKKIGVMPTDTIYGIHCLAKDNQLINKIYQIKQRATDVPLITVISKIEDLDQFGIKLNKYEQKITEELWPGPNTLIFNERSFRLPDNDFLASILNSTGPLISTSANLHKRPHSKTVEEAINYFGENIDFYVDGGELNNPPSSVYKISDDSLIKIR